MTPISDPPRTGYTPSVGGPINPEKSVGKQRGSSDSDYNVDSVGKQQGNSDDMPPADGTSPTTGTTDAVTAAEQQMQADLYAFMAMMQKLAQSLKTFSKLQAADDLRSQVDALTQAAQEMDEASTKRLKASYIQSAMQVAGGFAQGIAGAMAAHQTLKSADHEVKGKALLSDAETRTQQLKADAALPSEVPAADQPQGPLVANPDKLSPIQRLMIKDYAKASKIKGEALTKTGHEANAWSQALHALSGAAGSGVGATGTTASAQETREADKDDQQKQLQEVKAKQSEAEQSQNQQLAQAMQDLIADVNQLARQQMEAQANVNSQILRV
jgi:hypothetical protein